MTKQRKRSTEDGYTLTELLFVLVILGLISAAIAPRIIGRLDTSKVKSAELQLETLSASIDTFFIDNGRYPNDEEGLNVLILAPEGLPSWSGPYVRAPKNLIDPWGNEFVYVEAASGSGFRLTSLGRDGEPGGEGLATDLHYPDFSQINPN